MDWDGQGLPPVGVELDGVKVISQFGVEEWQEKPTWKVVGHHVNGNRFFVEPVGGGHVSVFTVGCSQYRSLSNIETPAEREERERLEAAYKLYLVGMGTSGIKPVDFNVFKDDYAEFFLAIVKETGYRKKGKD